MKKTARPPRFLPEILQAIYELKETGGSNSNKIVSHVKSNLETGSRLSTPRNLSTQVRRALNHATNNGIVQQRAGKFRINTALLSPFKDCMECKRRRRMQKKGRRRRRVRKHSIAPSISYSEFGSDSEGLRYRSDSESEEFPVRELRRRRKSKRPAKRRRRRRRSSHARMEPLANMDQDKENFCNDAVYPDDHREGEIADSHQCDNPDCLCNVKEELDDSPSFDPPM